MTNPHLTKASDLYSGTALSRRGFLQVGAGTIIGTAVVGSAPVWIPAPAQAATKTYEFLVESNGTSQRTYNGQSPGPIISANPGDTIDLKLINKMDPITDDCVNDPNTPHGTNTTNFHTHGLHVSPDKDSTGVIDADNVFLKVVPEGQIVPCANEHMDKFRFGKNDFRFELPAQHPPGTHWYHAHKHGSTAIQVISGLAGPLIINDPPGHMPTYIEDAPERIIMILAAGAVVIDPVTGEQSDPLIELAPGAVERWRVINANPGANSFVNIDAPSADIELYQIAFDGLTLPKRVPVMIDNNDEPWMNHAALAPGNRTDLMVRVKKTAKQESLLAFGSPVDKKFLPEEPSPGLALAAAPVVVAIKVTGTPIEAEWSDDEGLPGPGLNPITSPIAEIREVFFGPGTTINDKKFEEEPLFKMKLDTNEEWIVSNRTVRTHPFHIHVNPFFVTHINGEELTDGHPLRRWQDTISLPPNDGTKDGSITFRTHFADFTGKFVIHCHILFHEDSGMMRAVEIVV